MEDMLKVAWHVAIFDEAHKLKNRSSKTYEACCQLPTKLRYGLTGTAMQVASFMPSFHFTPVSASQSCLQAKYVHNTATGCLQACR